jgi:hypothetical protein
LPRTITPASPQRRNGWRGSALVSRHDGAPRSGRNLPCIQGSVMLKFFASAVGIIFLIGLLVVVGLLMLIF